ncbi:radical SAM protein, partial [Candidatus Poribacteria bacterium]|nr:radical SAM protein [Candidatus Poribacteria bacterium]
LHALAKKGFIVPQDADEGELYIQGLSQAKDHTEHLHVTLSLIQKCNLGCWYCYQGGDNSTHDGSKITKKGFGDNVKTAEIIAFLQSQCEERNVKRLHFTAYGGEPLLNKPALLEIVKAMQTYCKQEEIQWSFDMVSNGSLLNRKTVLELKQYGFVKVQITIDGNRETHNQSRVWRNPKGVVIGTYDLIMENLEQWAGLIRTDVLCVVSQSNLDAAHELINTLADKGLAKKHVRMMFSPISPTYDVLTLEETVQHVADHPEVLTEILNIIEIPYKH